MRAVLRVYRKGIIILPKKLREAIGISEGDEVLAEVAGDKIVLRVLKPKVVDVDLSIVEEILREEYGLERIRYKRMVSSGETSSRH